MAYGQIPPELLASLHASSPDAIERVERQAIEAELLDIIHNINVAVSALDSLRRRRDNLMGRLSSKSNPRANPLALQAILQNLDAGKILACIMAVVESGDVLSFSRTRKGNALVISLYDGTDNDREYPETLDETDAVLDAVLNAYGAQYLPQNDTPAPRDNSPTRKASRIRKDS